MKPNHTENLNGPAMKFCGLLFAQRVMKLYSDAETQGSVKKTQEELEIYILSVVIPSPLGWKRNAQLVVTQISTFFRFNFCFLKLKMFFFLSIVLKKRISISPSRFSVYVTTLSQKSQAVICILFFSFSFSGQLLISDAYESAPAFVSRFQNNGTIL